MKHSVWHSDWFIGIPILLIFLLLSANDVFQGLEKKAYDLSHTLASVRTVNERIVIIEIDQKSVDQIGRWPWSRDVLGTVVKKLGDNGAKVIGLDIDLHDAQNARGLKYIKKFSKLYSTTAPEMLSGEFTNKYEDLLWEAETRLNTDRVLGSAIKKSKNVVLAMPYFADSQETFVETPELPKFIAKNVVKPKSTAKTPQMNQLSNWYHSLSVTVASELVMPLNRLGKYALAVGHNKIFIDSDDVLRTEKLLLRYGNALLPSYPLMIASFAKGLSIKDVSLVPENALRMGEQLINIDAALQIYPKFYQSYKPGRAFSTESFYDVYRGAVSYKKFKDKVVLIGLHHPKLIEDVLVPTGEAIPPLYITANTVSALLESDYFYTPDWAFWVDILVMLSVAFYLMSVLPRIRLVSGLAASAILIVILFNTHLVMMVTQSIWLQLMTPIAMLIIGHAILTAKRVYGDNLHSTRVEIGESNRMLGLTFQAQGQLDMAFEKFRKCPLDDATMELLYNLGLDYETKRQFNKAGSVFRYISDYNENFRDVRKRILSNHEMSGLYVHRGASGANTAGTIILNKSGVQKPMLGRYQIEKEIGRGAMGLVYLGKDVVIDRTVAIKTMALSQEFEDEQLKEVKERFFREARTAGRLHHPNIVTIYDVGEEYDLAYIAMDFLEGKDLGEFTKPDNLLPLPEVFNIINKIAHALNYAHSENVVHRDIKPTNVVYHRSAKKVTMTDFGVACLLDSSKTKTGTVLGTPSYMSPEQLAGKKVDGQSDLFSLGVMFFQLLTGELPFVGDSMANLMFKISNDQHPDVRMFRPELPEKLSNIINKCLHKDVEKRYQTGKQIVHDLNKVYEHLKQQKEVAR